MTNIFNFPTQETRNWAEWTRLVRRVALGLDLPVAAADHVLRRARPLFDLQCNDAFVSLSITEDCVAAFDGLNERINIAIAERDKRAMFERIQREFELYRLHGLV